MSDSHLSKIAPQLAVQIEVWQNQLASSTSPSSEPFQIKVLVTYEGDLTTLQAAGLITGIDTGAIVFGLIALKDVEALAAVPSVVRIDIEQLAEPLLDDSVEEISVPWTGPPVTPPHGKGGNSIVAVVDTGIDIFHDSFRHADGKTRILEMWDQDISATGGNPPPPAPLLQQGRVYTNKQINDAIAAGPPFGSTDVIGHGTHVAGIAAGNGLQDDRCSHPGRYVGVAPLADLIVVKAISLSKAPPGSTPALSSPLDAITWCLQARARHSNRPMAVNCSFGAKTGPHDGTSSQNQVIETLLNPGGTPPAGQAVVFSAGNYANDHHHESGTLAANTTTTVSFFLPTGVLENEHIDIWYNPTSSINLSITAPPNPSQPPPNTIGPIAPGSPVPIPSPTIGGMSLGIQSNAAPYLGGIKKNISVTISPAPPSPPPPAGTAPPSVGRRSGIWQLTLTETSGNAATWDIWMASSTHPGPSFKLPDDSDDLIPRRVNNTIGDFAHTPSVITVANYADDDEINESSSRGPFPVPAGLLVGQTKPTIAAPGTDIASPRSRNDPESNSSCCDQKVIDKTGTSMSAPHVAGVVALMFEKNSSVNFEIVRAHLQHSAVINDIPPAEQPQIYDPLLNIRASHIWGSGRLHAGAALAEMPALGSAGGGSSGTGGTGGTGGGGGPGGGGSTISIDGDHFGYTPHTIFSRLGAWQSRFGPRPGLMLVASLISKHVDEVLRLINGNKKVGAVWQRQGGPLLVRHLLAAQHANNILLPAAVDGFDVGTLFERFLPVVNRYCGDQLRFDIQQYREFVRSWPGAEVQLLDAEALKQTRVL